MKNFYKELRGYQNFSEEEIIEDMNKTERLLLTEELLSQETDFSFFKEFKNLCYLQINNVFDSERLLSIPFNKLVNLKEVKIYHNYISDLLALLPDSIEKLEIQAYHEGVIQKQSVGDEIGRFQNLKTLSIESSNIIEISPQLGKLKNLQYLNIYIKHTKTSLPETIKDLGIETFSINIYDENPDINFLGEIVSSLKNLNFFYLFHQKGNIVPDWVFGLKNLEVLLIEMFMLQEIPEDTQNLTNLRELAFTNCAITSIPRFITKLQKLESLVFSNTDLNEIPEYIKELPHIKHLGVVGCINLLTDEGKVKNLKEKFPNIKIRGI